MQILIIKNWRGYNYIRHGRPQNKKYQQKKEDYFIIKVSSSSEDIKVHTYDKTSKDIKQKTDRTENKNRIFHYYSWKFQTKTISAPETSQIYQPDI